VSSRERDRRTERKRRNHEPGLELISKRDEKGFSIKSRRN